MLASDAYELVDFGAGRKLERFGPYLFDRPSPAAERARRRHPHAWSAASARFERVSGEQGSWTCLQPVETPWPFALGQVTLELKLTDFGHLGVFPEQADNWRWIDAQVRRAGRPKVLNLFAYTGASTLVAAAAGAEVVHVDAAANVVAWARRNAEASGLADAPIRWIAEDALKFVRRELKRGQSYDAVLLDPPAYGHGPGGEIWKLETQLDDLLAMCFELCRGRVQFMLLSCHSGELATAEGLLRFVRRNAATGGLAPRAVAMELATAEGARLPAGAAVRWIQQ
jgi:23S rRNA (cytosine1962-C5)-methyltransferase